MATDAKKADESREMGIRAVLLLIRNRFLTGLAFGVPLVVTIWLFVLVYRLIVSVGRPVIDFIVRIVNMILGLIGDGTLELSPPEYVLQLVATALPILVFLGLGFMATNFIGKHVLGAVDRILLNFPLVSYVYAGLKQAIEAFKSFGQAEGFKRVVYVEYPSPGCRLLGFVTSQFVDPQLNGPVTSVFIPTAPNPMTGFVIVIEDDKVTDSHLSLEQATKMILSAGLVAPEGGAIGSERMGERQAR